MRASRNASCMDAKILLFKDIDSVADGTRTMATIEKHTTPTSQPACKLLQRVLNKSVERQTEYQCNTRSVRRECAIESTRRECDACNLRGSHLGSRAKILVLDQLSAAVGRPVCFCEYFGLGSFSQYHVDNISDPRGRNHLCAARVHDSGHQISADPVEVMQDISVNARQAKATARRCLDGAGARFNDRQIALLEQTAPGRHCMSCARRS